ncbi:hypothetical protein J6590_011349 [Homalodisca vitripennis]|nr:hypothetical protein J6590_011349 [Homalodisca vitripennis]
MAKIRAQVVTLVSDPRRLSSQLTINTSPPSTNFFLITPSLPAFDCSHVTPFWFRTSGSLWWMTRS